jgi:hypothetical protein
LFFIFLASLSFFLLAVWGGKRLFVQAGGGRGDGEECEEKAMSQNRFFQCYRCPKIRYIIRFVSEKSVNTLLTRFSKAFLAKIFAKFL